MRVLATRLLVRPQLDENAVFGPMSPLDVALRSFHVYGRLLHRLVVLSALLLGPPTLLFTLAEYRREPTLALAAGVWGFLGFHYYFAAVTLSVNYYLRRLTVGAWQQARMIARTSWLGLMVLGAFHLVLLTLALRLPPLLGGGVPATALGLAAWLWLATATFTAPQVVVIEARPPAAALRRSWVLSRGHRLRTLAAVTGCYLSGVAAFVGLEMLAERTGLAAGILVDLAATVVVLPLGLVVPTVLYFDIRARHQGHTPDPEPIP